jgi:regulator of sigma E protease
LKIVSFVILLGVLVFIHELGHFLAARLAGIGVKVFSLGFGPRLFGFSRGGTDYRVSALPLGGYVKMEGEPVGEALTGARTEFGSRSVLTRALVVATGPVMNLVLALALFPAIYLIGVPVSKTSMEPPVIGFVAPETPASRSGFAEGDLITAIDGRHISTWEEAEIDIASSPGRDLSIKILRGGAGHTLALVPMEDSYGIGYAGFAPAIAPLVGALSAGDVAEKAGLKTGDRIERIDGLPVSTWAAMTRVIRASPDKTLSLTVLRDGVTLPITVTPRRSESGTGMIGILPREETVIVQHPLGEAVRLGFKRFRDFTRLTFVTIGRLFTFQLSLKAMGGPIQIAQASGAAAESGLATFIGLMAFMSLQLGLLNLLPIPVLDGGHLVFFVIEWIMRRPLSVEKREMAQQIGLILLVTLMVLVSINDVRRLVGQ